MKQTFLSLILLSVSSVIQSQTIVSRDTSSVDTTVNRQLKEVMVTADIPQVRLTAGGIIATISGTTLSNAGTCFDVIIQLPGVRSDEGKIEIPGKGTPLIYVNNRKIIDSSELHRLSSKDVRSIEVITNPGAKYGADIRSVINIKTIPKRGDGLSGSINGSGRIARYLSQSYNLFLNYRTGNLDIFSSFNFDYARRYQKQKSITEAIAGPDRYTIESSTYIYPKGISDAYNFGMNWMISQDQYIGAKYEYNATPYSRSRWLTDEYVSINHTPVDSIGYVTRWNIRSLPTNSINLYYSGKIKSVTLNITNDYYYQHNNSRQSIMETNAPEEIGSDSRITNRLIASKGVCEYKIDKTAIELGYELTSTDRKDIFVNINDLLPDADDRIRETTEAAFLSVNHSISKFELTGGVRFEHTESSYYDNGKIIPAQSRKYSRWYPAFDFTFPIGKANFTLYYTAKTKRPLYSQLSSSIQYDDRFTYETGNPLLVPEMIHDITLAGIYKWIFFSAGYQYYKNAIVSIIEPFEQDSPINIMTYTNYPHISKYNIIVALSPKINRWSPRLRLNILGQSFTTPTLGRTKSLDNPLLFYNIYNSITLGRGIILNADLTGRTRGDMDVVTILPSWQINLGITKNINNWYLQLMATDIFRTARNSMISYGSHMIFDKWNYSDTQSARLIIRYSFNTAISRYKGKSAGASEKQRL